MFHTVFITTPCLNSIATLDRTILSVITQAGDFYIRYHLQDGGSTDGTLERLAWWQSRLASQDFPIQCLGIDFTFVSAPDTGMYDALCMGFSAMTIPANSFMTWINSDDILAQGALAFITNVERQFSPQQVSWVGGGTSILRGNDPLLSFDSPIPKAALKAGLCDGVHWNFLQQEGTFFRNWLWSSVNPEQSVRPLKLAGDWNLWRLFAERSWLVQTKFVLGSFRIQNNQLSARLRDKYMAEIDGLVPLAERKGRLAGLAKTDPITRRLIKLRYSDGHMSVTEEDLAGLYIHNHEKIHNTKPAKVTRLPAPQIIAEGHIKGPVGSKPKSLDEIVSFKDNILAFDSDWQFPAITEQHAYHQLRDMGSIPDGVTYVAYPWANLIDKLQTKAQDTQHHLSLFRQFCRLLPPTGERVTVCQHIKMQEFMYLFEEAGIQNIFWTHATHQDMRDNPKDGITLHPFPLYPVQVPEETDVSGTQKRPYLFSFIGAKSNKYYLTNARELILDTLRDDPRGLIIGRDGWHYNKVVYEHQIHQKDASSKGKAEDLVNQSASDQFKASLAESLFSLCPAGSGPNSIRLWESLGAGSIPVILADTYAPPGNRELWEQAAVFCEETAEAIAALPDRLEEIAKDTTRIAKMRHAMRQLWLLYGPHSFVYDIQVLMLRLADQRSAPTKRSAVGKQSLRQRLLERIPVGRTPSAQDAQFLLQTCSCDLLLDGRDLLNEFRDQESRLGQAIEMSLQYLGADHPAVQHYHRVCDHIDRSHSQKLAAAQIGRNSGLKICLFGRHANRTPLSYAPFQRSAGTRISFVDDMMLADIVMTGFNIDIRENAEQFEKLANTRKAPKVVVLSEEPLWDSIWSDGFTERTRKIKCGDTELTYSFLNHSNTSIFDFEKIPYFLLTSEDYISRYGLLIARHAHISPRKLLEHWKTAPLSAAFFAEVREGDLYSKTFKEQDVYGLSSYRTDVARKVDLPNVLREGKGWNGDVRRQALPDWHMDKLAALDMKVRIASSFENTHQNSYVSEKIFDAFVVGAIPTYYAGPSHRIFSLVPEDCMINTFGMTADQAASKIQSFAPDIELAESWLKTAQRLQSLFTSNATVLRERQRVTDAIMGELQNLIM